MRRLALAALLVAVLAGCEDPDDANVRRLRSAEQACPRGALSATLNSRGDGPDIDVRCRP